MAAAHMKAPPDREAQGRGKNGGRGKPTRSQHTVFHPPAQSKCRLPESRDGACAQPLSCPCRGRRMIEKLVDLEERLARGYAIAAEHLDTSERVVADLVALELDIRRDSTPERRAAREVPHAA